MVIALLSALAAAWLLSRPGPSETAAIAAPDQRPRYQIEGMTLLRTGATGAPQMQVLAKSGDYYPDGHAEFSQIEVRGLGSDRNAPWRLTAPSGSVPSKEKRILLHTPVDGSGQWPNGEPLAFHGSEVWADQDKQQFYSDRPVQVLGTTRQAKGSSFVAGFNGKTLSMNHVELQYVLSGQ